MTRKSIKIWRQVAKVTRLNKMILVYLLLFAILAYITMRIEPEIDSYGDALWYCFASSTTIGFGDLTAVTAWGRLVTVFLFIYTLVILAVFTAVSTQFIFESIKASRSEATSIFLDDLEHLEDLSKERLAEMSAGIRKRRNK